MKTISLEEVEKLAHTLAKKQMKWGEPIPDFGTRYPGKLESCLATVFQTYNKRDLYPTLIDKSAVIFYLIIKNHPFINGNKRIAVSTLLVFLSLNDKWLHVTNEEIYELSVIISKSSPKLRRGIIELIKDFIDKNLENY